MKARRLGLVRLIVLMALFVTAGCGLVEDTFCGKDKELDGIKCKKREERPSPNTAPTIISAPERFAKENTPYSYKVLAVDPENDPLRFNLKIAPAGMNIDATTGEVSWVPTSAEGGEHAVEVSVSDGRKTGSQDFTVKVQISSVVASKIIIASEGGTVEVTDPTSPIFGTKIEIPAGALPEDVTITLSSVSFPNYLPETVPVAEIQGNLPTQAHDGKSSDLKGHRMAPIPSDTQIIIPYSPEKDGTGPAQLNLYRYEAVKSCWPSRKIPKSISIKGLNYEILPSDIVVVEEGCSLVKRWRPLEVGTEVQKDTERHIFIYRLTSEEFASFLRRGSSLTNNPLRIGAANSVERSRDQMPFLEVIKESPDGFFKSTTVNLIMLHGIFSSSDNFRDPDGLIEFFKNDSHYPNILFYNYPWTEKIEENAKLLANVVIEIDLPNTFDIIAHSMGGAVARWAIEQPLSSDRNISSKVRNLFMLATPNWGVGIDLALYEKILGSAALGPGPRELLPKFLGLGGESDFVKELNATSLNTPKDRRRGTNYYLYTAATWHGKTPLGLGCGPLLTAKPHRVSALECIPGHSDGEWLDHASPVGDFVPVPKKEQLENLDIINFSKTFDGISVGKPGARYDHSTIHSECAKNEVCAEIVKVLNSTGSSPPPPQPPPALFTLNISPGGTGSGTVTGSGISCPGDCFQEYPSGTNVTLTASANSGSVFGSWSECTSASGTTCNVTMNADKIVTATFNAVTSSPPDTPPDTIIDSGPPASTTSTSATFNFHATENGSTFECKLDAGSFAACSSPQVYSALAVGSHTFSVRAVDVAGNRDLTPASHTWTIEVASSATDLDTKSANFVNRSFTHTGGGVHSSANFNLAAASGITVVGPPSPDPSSPVFQSANFRMTTGSMAVLFP